MNDLNYDTYTKEREKEFNQIKKKFTFSLRGEDKYYNAFQCAKFEKNLIENKFDCITTQKAVEKEGLYFNKYSITLGHPYGHDLRRFNSPKEMFGYIAGYNDAINNAKYYGLGQEEVEARNILKTI